MPAMANPVRSRLYAQRGASLLEMLTTLAIIATLASFALPVFTVLEREESSRVLRQFLTLVETGRSAAIRHGHTITLCPVNEQRECAGDWQTGAMLYIDSDESRHRSDDEDLLALVLWPDLRGRLEWRAFGNRQRLLIDRYGGLTGQNGNLSWCPPDDSNEPAHQLVLNGSGRFRFARDNDGDGYREDSQGRPLRCT